MGVNQGLQPIASYNYGANNPIELNKSLKSLLYIQRSSGLLDQSLELYFQYNNLTYFTKDKSLISEATFVLRLQLLFFWTIGLQMVASTFYQSLGKPIPSLFLSILRQFIILIPLIHHFTSIYLTRIKRCLVFFSHF